MKLIKFNLNTKFNELRDLMRAPYIEWGEGNWENLNADRILSKLKGKKGIEVEDLRKYIQEDGTFEYQGHKVLVYIRDQYVYHQYYTGETGYKYHLANCQTLTTALRNNRISRYVLSQRIDGLFLVKAIDKSSNRVLEETEKKLKVCKNCLQYLNYEGYDYSDYFKRKTNDEIYYGFDLSGFFQIYKGSLIVSEPEFTDITAPTNIYPENFDDIALRVKQINKWTCERCGLTLNDNKKFLHAHHKDANKANNSLSNLESLCIKCHADEPGHAFLKKNPDYNEFLSSGLAIQN